MRYTEVVDTINRLGADRTLDFVARSHQIEHLLDTVSEGDILDHLDHAGIIPEAFQHDSTEEKLFAKYCDALLCRTLALLGMNAEVIAMRADSADVSASLNNYTVVGDAKAFRLSRTAKNQKDFKVEALNSWRKGAEYATLCAPLFQYPSSNSQIYLQASTYNVTLLSYTHLAFLLRRKPANLDTLESLWKISSTITASKDAASYWVAVNRCVVQIAQSSMADWQQAELDAKNRLPELAEEQIRFWTAEKERIQQLDHDAAVVQLIEALKIDSKIKVIRDSIKV